MLFYFEVGLFLGARLCVYLLAHVEWFGASVPSNSLNTTIYRRAAIWRTEPFVMSMVSGVFKMFCRVIEERPCFQEVVQS